MPETRLELHRTSAASGFLAAAICMAIAQIIGLLFWTQAIGSALLYGLSLSFVAFGFTYAMVFFVSLARAKRTMSPR